MPNSDIDPTSFANDEREAWDSVSTAWRDWFPMFEAGAQSLNERLVELAGVQPGHRVLDVATGIGEPAVTAARVAGATGRVLACDLSPGMLAIGRDRAAGFGIDMIEFAEQDATAIDVGKEPFDAAVCRWGLMLMLDPDAAVRSIRGLLRPGGRFAASVWGPGERVPFIATGGRVLRREMALPPADPDAPGPFRLPDVGKVRALFEGAGFVDVATEEFVVRTEFSSAEMYSAFVSELSSSARKLLATVDDERRVELLRAIAEEAGKSADADGVIRFENLALVVVGMRA